MAKQPIDTARLPRNRRQQRCEAALERILLSQLLLARGPRLGLPALRRSARRWPDERAAQGLHDRDQRVRPPARFRRAVRSARARRSVAAAAAADRVLLGRRRRGTREDRVAARRLRGQSGLCRQRTRAHRNGAERAGGTPARNLARVRVPCGAPQRSLSSSRPESLALQLRGPIAEQTATNVAPDARAPHEDRRRAARELERKRQFRSARRRLDRGNHAAARRARLVRHRDTGQVVRPRRRARRCARRRAQLRADRQRAGSSQRRAHHRADHRSRDGHADLERRLRRAARHREPTRRCKPKWRATRQPRQHRSARSSMRSSRWRAAPPTRSSCRTVKHATARSAAQRTRRCFPRRPPASRASSNGDRSWHMHGPGWR